MASPSDLERKLRNAGLPVVGVTAVNITDRHSWGIELIHTATSDQLLAAQNILAGFDITAPSVPDSITPTQAKRQLLAMGLMSSDEAIGNSVPAFLKAVMDQMTVAGHPEQAAEVALRWHNAVEWLRDDPLFAGGLLAAAAEALGQPATPELVDQFFTTAGALT